MADENAHDPICVEALEWRLLFSSGDATAADAEAFARWQAADPRHAMAFADAVTLWEGLAAAARLSPARHFVSPAPIRYAAGLPRRAFLSGAMAASAAGVFFTGSREPLALWPTFAELSAQYRTGTGEQRTIQAVPNVAVEMNTQTSLNLDGQGTNFRTMELVSGEAAVVMRSTRSDPFELKARRGTIKATDADFNVRCVEEDVTVSCLRGKIEVAYLGRQRVVNGNERISFGNGELGVAEQADNGQITAWRNGKLVFSGVPLSEVIREINRYRPGRIVLLNETIGRKPVQAVVPIGQASAFPDLVHAAYGATVTLLPGGLVLLS